MFALAGGGTHRAGRVDPGTDVDDVDAAGVEVVVLAAFDDDDDEHAANTTINAGTSVIETIRPAIAHCLPRDP